MTTSNVAVVTGAASGIGRATALRLARDGFEVAMMDLDAAGLAETRDQIQASGGGRRTRSRSTCATRSRSARSPGRSR